MSWMNVILLSHEAGIMVPKMLHGNKGNIMDLIERLTTLATKIEKQKKQYSHRRSDQDVVYYAFYKGIRI
jgi:hypothetical protein